MEYTVDLSEGTPPPRPRNNTNPISGWGRVMDTPTPFGNQEPGYWWLQCWQKYTFNLWFPSTPLWVGKRIAGTTDILWTLSIESGCGDFCGGLLKECICPYVGDGKTGAKFENDLSAGCTNFIISDFVFDHLYCPPAKPCEPDWDIFPIPSDCPNGPGITITLEARRPEGPAPTYGGPDPEETRGAIVERVNAVAGEYLKRARNAGYNMKCKGGEPGYPGR